MTEVSASGRVSLKPRLWQTATIVDIIPQSPRVRSYRLRPAEPFSFTAGQHAEVRLTAPDGYRAQRSYSISSAPEITETIELTIERLDDGEVSPYLTEALGVGDRLELRGPIGGDFVWGPETRGAPFFVSGRAGGVPPPGLFG